MQAREERKRVRNSPEDFGGTCLLGRTAAGALLLAPDSTKGADPVTGFCPPEPPATQVKVHLWSTSLSREVSVVVADSFEADKGGGPEGKLSWADTKRFRLRMGYSGRASHTDA